MLVLKSVPLLERKRLGLRVVIVEIDIGHKVLQRAGRSPFECAWICSCTLFRNGCRKLLPVAGGGEDWLWWFMARWHGWKEAARGKQESSKATLLFRVATS